MNLLTNIIYFLEDYLPILIVAIPFLISPIIFLAGNRSEKLRDMLGIVITATILILVIFMYPQAMDDGITINIVKILGNRIVLKVDMLSYIMALLTSIVWFFVSIYAFDYMFHEKHRNRFYAFMMLTLGGTLGTVIAGDLLSLFIFFEIMSFSAYVLVAHNQTREALDAGYKYIYMAVFGGICLLMGVLLYYSLTDTMQIMPIGHILEQTTSIKYLMFALFVIGFGIKAGVITFHIWLPKAHPVAPTPASALLSGILIKTGAYGILRIASKVYFPAAETYFDDNGQRIVWSLSSGLGHFLIWLGILTMFVGVFLALLQSNAKKLLAYHSISQMGYIVMGIGVSAYLGSFGIMGFSGAIYHMFNHAFFKAVLFLVVGAVYLKTDEYDLYKLGGLWRKMPFATLICLVAALGITGFPLFNGFTSKTVLHHAIYDAYKYGAPSLKYAEILFTITSAGTVCSFIKLFAFTFLGKCPDKYKDIKGESIPLTLGMGGLATFIILIGVFPNFFIQHAILPAIKFMSFEPVFTHNILNNLDFFIWYEIKGIVIAYLLGFSIFIIGTRFHLFHLHLPKWLSIEHLIYTPISKGFFYFCQNVCGRFDKVVDEDCILTKKLTEDPCIQSGKNTTLISLDYIKCQINSNKLKNARNLMNLDTDFMIFANLLVIVIVVLFIL